jgi:hypothetical protein
MALPLDYLPLFNVESDSAPVRMPRALRKRTN